MQATARVVSFRPVDAVRSIASISRVHIVVLAALTTLTFGWLFTGEHLWEVAGIAAFDWFAVSLLSRTTDLKEDAANRIPGVSFTARLRSLMRICSLALLCLSLGLFHAFEPSLTLVRVCFFLLAILYCFPLLPGRMRLKQIYIVKNVGTAIGFMLTSFAYPLAKANWGFFGLPVGIEEMTLLAAGAFLFLFALAFEVMHDLAHAPGDATVGIESFPVMLGSDLAITIIDRLLAFAAIALVLGFATHFVPWRIVVMTIAPLAIIPIYKRSARRGLPIEDVALIGWIISAMMLTYHAWIFLRLPGVLA